VDISELFNTVQHIGYIGLNAR